MKKAMGDVQKPDLQVAVENFVLSVFASIDKEERTCETVGKQHAVAFKRAGDFIQILSLFGALTPEWEERRKYTVYKAGTIMKALKAGEVPVRGNPFAPEEEMKKEENPIDFNQMGDQQPETNTDFNQNEHNQFNSG